MKSRAAGWGSGGLALLWVLALAGCGGPAKNNPAQTARVDTLEADLKAAREEIGRLGQELKEARTALTAAQGAQQALSTGALDADALAAENAELKAVVEAYDLALADLRVTLENLKQADTSAFANAGLLMEEKKWAEAVAAYEAFLQAYPDSPLRPDAERFLSRAKTEERRARRAADAQAEREAAAARERAVAERLRNGQMSLEELRARLLNRSGDEIRQVLGEPSQTYSGDRWRYADRVYNPAQGMSVSLRIVFTAGRATDVDYWGN